LLLLSGKEHVLRHKLFSGHIPTGSDTEHHTATTKPALRRIQQRLCQGAEQST
jgi:hypothetical protein